MNPREQSGYTGMNLSYSHLPSWSGDRVSAMRVAFTKRRKKKKRWTGPDVIVKGGMEAGVPAACMRIGVSHSTGGKQHH